MDPSAPFVWRCSVFGPSDTEWEGGVFQLQMQFGVDYPQKPPTVKFTSTMFHPNGERDDRQHARCGVDAIRAAGFAIRIGC